MIKSGSSMKLVTPAFGLISGSRTAMGLLPHILTLCFLLIMGIPPRSVASLVVFTIGAKLLGEWLFWKYYKYRMDSEDRFKKWRLIVNSSLYSHSNVIISVFMIFLDGLVDVMLVYTALKTPMTPVWIFLALFGCQLLSSPIQGVLSDYFSQKKSMLFAAVVGIVTYILSGELPVYEKIPDSSQFSLLNLIGLSSFTLSMQMVLILCVKGLFGNLAVIARAAIAETIKIETVEKIGEL